MLHHSDFNIMPNEDLNKEVNLKISIGHLLVIWDILSNKLSGKPLNTDFTEDEKRAIWALEDACEKKIVKSGIKARPEKEWNQLIERATKQVKTLPVEFLK
jgi:hypothetical protein